MTIILDMGGVLMLHNMSECIARFTAILGEEKMKTILGLAPNGEGCTDSLMEQYERGEVTTEQFVSTILSHAAAGTEEADVITAWISMHGGIPAERLALIRAWHEKGHRLFMLSNNNELHWQDVHAKYDMTMFEHCFASHLLHLSKPDPRIYQSVDKQLKEWGVMPPYHFVDDIAINRQTAEQLGWQTYESIYALNSLVD